QRDQQCDVLYALLVGINQYTEKPLNGCINDVNAMHQFLRKCYPDLPEENIKVLTDECATRDNFTTTFVKHFSQLSDGDSALFYFSGHGSDTTVPEGFEHTSSSGLLETLVLYDSRIGDGWDLVDKELSYLIWKVTKDKNVLLTMVIDSCHSGEIHRDIGDQTQRQTLAEELSRLGTQEVRTRSISSQNRHPGQDKRDPRPWQAYHGAKEYHKENGKISVKRGKSILLAACRPSELAKEQCLPAHNLQQGWLEHGLFTHTLLSILYASNTNLTYRALMNQVKTLVYRRANDQHPQLDFDHQRPKDLDRTFLDNQHAEGASTYLLTHHNRRDNLLPVGWLVKAGTINGIETGARQLPGKLLAFKTDPTALHFDAQADPGIPLTIDRVFATHSSIKEAHLLENKDQQYYILFTEFPASPLRFAFAENNEEQGTNILLDKWKQLAQKSNYLEHVPSVMEADYLVHAKNNQFWTQKRGNTVHVFQRIQGYHEEAAAQIFKNLETIAQWHRIKRANDLNSPLNYAKIELEFNEVTRPSDNFMEALEVKRIDDFLIRNPVLRYRHEDKTRDARQGDLTPRFQLKIHNHEDNRRPLWFSVLYLGSNYCISNQLLPVKKLDAGQSTFIRYFDPNYGITSDLIPLKVDNPYLNARIYEIEEHFKVIVSSQEFDTNDLNQDGLPFDPILDEPTRGLGSLKNVDRSKIYA
ncbi:MAG: caspase family protein, partial [Bacteroidota bacterium]